MTSDAAVKIGRTSGLMLLLLGGLAIGLFFATFYGMESKFSSLITGLGVFIGIMAFRLETFQSAMAILIGATVLGAGSAWALGPIALSPVVFVIGMVMALSGFILRVLNDH
ncbi:hypothetical protein [Pseudomonas syringae]|uniref:hypothetical protein n=1 Tax=Pseudomonas syringae TaxID=317 RepID=UPI00200B9B6F|nr:hypothetical protein [Pseudomonas syringae]MCK9709868.1 hypothetical protein [Pseudomonas syringae pv. syringae]